MSQVPVDYRGVAFIAADRPLVVAALLSASEAGIIAPPDGIRWFQRDLNEMHARHWAVPHARRADYLWLYRLTDLGRNVAKALREVGWTFDGWDPCLGETLMRKVR